MLIVMKFGGTSVANAERMRESARIVKDAAPGNRIVVVVSALAGVTDLILKTVHAATANSSTEVASNLRRLEELHHAVIADLFAGAMREQVLSSVNAVLHQFRDFCSALLLLRSTTPQVMDVALPMGEKMSAAIFASYLRELGGSGEYVDSAQVIVTDEKFGDAAPNMELTQQRSHEILFPLLEKGSVPVVTGYSGATLAGQPTTLGRGGSDYSATIIGAAIAADEVWIWTDVDGILTADPRICPSAMTLPEITFAEAIELSYYGAKVIHPKATRPAMDLGIPVWIKNSFKPQIAGTKIVSSVTAGNFPVRAVTAVTRASLVTLTTRRDFHFAEIFGRLFLRLAHDHIDLLFSTQSSSENALGLVLREQDTEHVLHEVKRLFRAELKHGILNPIFVQRDIAVIAVLGEAMKGTPGILARIFSTVASRNVSVIAVAQGASELNICFAVPAADAANVVHAVHDELLLGQTMSATQSVVRAT